MDYYSILGVKRNSSLKEITVAFRKLIKKHHPDKSSSSDRASEIISAYKTLSDKKLRFEYDLSLPFEEEINISLEHELVDDFAAYLESLGVKKL